MAYTYRVFDSFDEVDLAAWEEVRMQCGDSIVLDPRFMRTVESSMKQSCRLQYVVVYQDNSRPVASACITFMTIDLADFSDRRIAWIIRRLPRRLSRLQQLRMLVCGLPVSTAHHTLGIAIPSASRDILSIIDGIICRLASQTAAHAVIYREFRQEDLQWTSPLHDLGYRCIPGPPMYFFRPLFQDLQGYCAALKSHYRKQIRRSLRKLERSGVEVRVLADPEAILNVYTPEVHELYHQMRDRADVKFESLTVDYLRELASRLGSHVNLIAFSIGSRVIAFGWCIRTKSAYYMLYAGLDYALNDELDLYFNLHYAALDSALRSRVSAIELGATGDAFKARLGCYSQPSYIFAKGLTPVMSLVSRHGAKILFPQKPAIPAFEVFNSEFVADLRRS